MRKLTIEEIKERLIHDDKVNPNIKILVTHYINSKIDVECKKCGYIWDMTLGNIRKGKGCPNCYGNVRKTLDERLSMIYNKYPNITYIDGELKNGKSKITFYCNECDEIFTSGIHQIEDRGCPICNQRNAIETNSVYLDYHKTPRLTYNNFLMRLNFINKNITPIPPYKTLLHTKIKCVCDVCGNIWEVTPSNLLCGKGCPECGKHKGEEHWNYRKDISEEERREDRRYDMGYKSEFVIPCLKRDDYTCQVTGIKGGRLNVHHLNGYHWDKENRTNIKNGITLSKKIHRRFHNIYGNYNNTKEQFIEFINMLHDNHEMSDEYYYKFFENYT